MAPGPDRILVARVGAPHGVRGEVRVKSFTSEPSAFASYGPLATDDGGTLEVTASRPVPKTADMLIVRFRDVADRDAAARLTNRDLFVPRDRLPPVEDADEFYQADLIGLTALDPAGGEIGRVVAVENFGAGDILEIAPATGPSFYVPFTRECVPSMDIAGGRISLVPPTDFED